MGDEGVGEENELLDPIQEEDTRNNEDSTVHESKEEDKPEEDNDITVETVNNEEEQEKGEIEEQHLEEVVLPALVPRPRAVQELESNLDGRH